MGLVGLQREKERERAMHCGAFYLSDAVHAWARVEMSDTSEMLFLKET